MQGRAVDSGHFSDAPKEGEAVVPVPDIGCTARHVHVARCHLVQVIQLTAAPVVRPGRVLSLLLVLVLLVVVLLLFSVMGGGGKERKEREPKG